MRKRYQNEHESEEVSPKRHYTRERPPDDSGAEGADLCSVLRFRIPHQRRGRKQKVMLSARKCRRHARGERQPTPRANERAKRARKGRGKQ